MTTGKRVLRAVCLVAVVGVVVGALAADPPDAETLFRKGMASFKQKSFRPAADAFTEHLKRFPKAERAREVQFYLGESYRIARRFGRESTYPKAEEAYKKLTESEQGDRWRARGYAGMARLNYAWRRWSHRQQIEDLYKKAIADYERGVSKASPRELRRELAEVVCDRLQMGLQAWGYHDGWREVQAAQQKRIQADQPVGDHEKKQVEWWATAVKLVAKVDALDPGKDLEARARWILGQRGSDEHLKAVVEKYADTEYWDDAVMRLARQREGQRKFLDALALYKRLTDRFTERQSRYVKQAHQRAAEIRKPRLTVRCQFAGLPGTKPRIQYSWRNQKQAALRIFATQPFGHPRHRNLLEMAKAAKGQELKSWTKELENKAEHQHYNAEQDLELADEGVYLVTADAGGVHAETLVLITRLAAITKTSSDRAKVFVADAMTGEPVQGADVQTAWWYRSRNQNFWDDSKGVTDDAGMHASQRPGNTRYRQYFILARKGGSYAFASSYRSHWSPMQPGLWFYGYTDRPAYRPDEEVHFKFVVRNYDGKAFRNVGGQRYHVWIQEPRGGKLYDKTLTTSDWGTLSDTVKLSKEPKLGQYTVHIRTPDNKSRQGYARFRVEEYKLPEYKVDIATVKPTYRVGDTMDVKIAASYYFGGPVQEAEVEVVVRQNQYWHFYHPPHAYPWYYDSIYRSRWGSRYYRRGGGAVIKQEKLKTDEHGVATLTIETPKLPEDPRQQHDYSYRIEARVVDKSRREIKSNKTLRVTVKPFYVYVNPKAHVYLPGDRMEIDVTARNANDQPVKTQGMVRAYRAVYNEEKAKKLREEGKPHTQDDLYDLTELAADKLATDAEGKAAWAYVPDQPGYIKLEMTALTEKEEKVIGSSYVWVASKDERYLGYRLSGVQVIPNKQTSSSATSRTPTSGSGSRATTSTTTSSSPSASARSSSPCPSRTSMRPTCSSRRTWSATPCSGGTRPRSSCRPTTTSWT